MASSSTVQSENDSAQTLVSKRSATSVVWKFFGFKKEDAAQCQVFCRTCRATIATSRGNTTNLYQHKKYHKAMYDSCMANMPSTAMFESITPYERNSKRHESISRVITEFLAKDMVPISTVSKP
ncbi:hypothetical protein F2P81_018421 [Scophthalmus maximus]|uniref:BED-type domain-containing protein n=1 Tax=Scophthalmus maximus TaxID=52904 RepID=A0A6A4S276_SCOMX|nr:hypothetical protein F2P81_018421 [Scophthalmus maximus]